MLQKFTFFNICHIIYMMIDLIYKVYVHKNKFNFKIYIGITCQEIQYRWGKNGNGYNTYNRYESRFWNAIQKYGWDSFDHIVLFDRLTQKEAEEIEIELIAYHNATDENFGYNMQKGGSSAGKHSEEAKRKIAEANSKRVITEETRQKMKDNHYDGRGENGSFYGHHHTEESKRKMSLAKKGKYVGEQHHNYGKPMSEEQKKKISQTRKDRKIQAWNKGLKNCYSEETRKKISQNLKGKMSGDKNPMFGKTGFNSPYHREIICLDNLQIYSSAREASRELGLIATNITRVCRGKQSHCGGYHFMYLEDYNKNFKTL